MRLQYFEEALANETQCVQYPALSTSLPPLSLTPSKSTLFHTPIPTTTETLAIIFPTPIPTTTETLTTIHRVDQHTLSDDRVITYIIGILGALALTFGTLVVALSILYFSKFRKRKIRTSIDKYQKGEVISHSTLINSDIDAGSLNEALASTQTAPEGDSIYSIVDDVSSYQDSQTLNALPYETAVFHSPNHTQQASASSQGDEMEGGEEYSGSHSSTHGFDEHHLYDEVKHEVKIHKYTTGRTERTVDLKLFDDVVYSSHPSHDTNSESDTKLSMRHLETNIMINNNHVDVDGGIIASETSTGQNQNTEPVVAEKQTEEMRCSNEHLYDSADQMNKGQTRKPAIQTTINGDNHNREADGTKYTYHSLELPESGSPGNPEAPTGHLSTTVQDINSQSVGGGPTLCNCQFDDPMYESTPHPGANLNVIATASSMKADASEPQEDESTMQGNPKLLQKYNGDAENFIDAPHHSDPIDLAPVDNTLTMDNQDKVNRNLASIYDMFDDPTYGVCVTLDPTK